MDDEAEVEIVELPSEHRIIRWDDGGHSIYKVYLKDGKPFSYDDDGIFDFPCFADRADLEAALLEIGAAIAHAISLPTLSENDDFPGQERPDFSAMFGRGADGSRSYVTTPFDDDGE